MVGEVGRRWRVLLPLVFKIESARFNRSFLSEYPLMSFFGTIKRLSKVIGVLLLRVAYFLILVLSNVFLFCFNCMIYHLPWWNIHFNNQDHTKISCEVNALNIKIIWAKIWKNVILLSFFWFYWLTKQVLFCKPLNTLISIVTGAQLKNTQKLKV